MELNHAIEAFGSLAQGTRLQAFKLLIEYGRTGTPAGTLSRRLGVPQSTLSFHLAHLQRAGLIHSTRVGKQIIYTADSQAVESLILYLRENCCVLEIPKDGSGECCPNPPKAVKPRKSGGIRK